MSIAIVGVGPRGISVTERLAALAPTTPVDLHLIDDAQLGAGRIWETDQTRTLCMNTLAHAVTLFTEPGSSVQGPVLEGPTLFEWARILRGERTDLSSGVLATVDTYPPDPGLAEAFGEELPDLVEESHPSRALYGAYLRWVFDVALGQLPDTVRVHQHHARAVDLRPGDGDSSGQGAAGESGTPAADVIALSNGTTVTADATVLALGWQTPGPTAEETALAEAVAASDGALNWVRPDNPVEQDLSGVPEGPEEKVLVRGLGMGFFDVMALLTINRGGRFVADPSARSGLRYEASGREPHLVVSSHRGYPYVPKSDYHSLPPTPRTPRLDTVEAELGTALAGGADPIDFTAQVRPAVLRDAHEEYYRTLQRVRPEALADAEGLFAAIDATNDVDSLPAELSGYLAEGEEPFRPEAWFRPLSGVSGTPAEVTGWIGLQLARDIAEGARAWDSPLKAGLWALSATRKRVSILGAQGRYTEDSRADLREYQALGQMVGSGPPLFRSRQLLALVDAGLVTFLGAGTRLSVVEGGSAFELTADSTAGHPVRATTLIDAWMHQPRVDRAADPLAAALERDSRWRPFRSSGSPETDFATRRLVLPTGELDPRLHLIGIPTYGQHPDTTISPMPGTDPLMLRETDAAAIDALAATGIRPGAQLH